MIEGVSNAIILVYGDCSSVGRVPDCDSGCRGFEPRQSPHLTKALGCYRLRAFSLAAQLLNSLEVEQSGIGEYQLAVDGPACHDVKGFW